MLGADGHAVQCADARAAPLEVGGPIDALAALYHPKLPARGACMLCTETGEIDVVEVPGLVISHKSADHLVDDPIRSGVPARAAIGIKLRMNNAHMSATLNTASAFRSRPDLTITFSCCSRHLLSFVALHPISLSLPPTP